MKEEVIKLEFYIAQQRTYIVMEEEIETEMASGELDPESVFEQSELKSLDKMESEGEVHEPAALIIEEKRGLLSKAFGFFSFGIEINEEQRQYVFNNNYNRLLEKELIDQKRAFDELFSEVEAQRALSHTFKENEEKSLKKIQEITLKYNMCVEDRKQDKIAFDKRINQLIRDFVKIYKTLSKEFKYYKDFVGVELEIFK
jgi:hypothetical protein